MGKGRGRGWEKGLDWEKELGWETVSGQELGYFAQVGSLSTGKK
jgi:hypothetical protein